LRYFNMGSITFTDMNGGNLIRDFKPAEFAVGRGLRTAVQRSILRGCFPALRQQQPHRRPRPLNNASNTKAGQAVAADVSFFYRNTDLVISSKDATLAFGLDISNVGNKIVLQRQPPAGTSCR
jgi:hypothetical protein